MGIGNDRIAEASRRVIQQEELIAETVKPLREELKGRKERLREIIRDVDSGQMHIDQATGEIAE